MVEILSVQSGVVFGRVGNAAAAFALQRLGHDLWPLPTTLLSSHAAYPGVTGRRLPGTEVAELIRGLEAAGVPDRAGALLTGYLGGPDTARAVADLAARMTAARPGLPYLCDPVLGDEGPGLYLPAETGEIVRRDLIPRATIATPNAFELGWLTGHAPRTVAETRAAALALVATGPARVFVTGIRAGLPEDQTGILAVEAGAAALVRTPRLPHRAEGAGDLAAALILAHQLAGRGIAETAAMTAASLMAVLEATLAAGQRELAIVAAQDALADPPDRFTATPL